MPFRFSILWCIAEIRSKQESVGVAAIGGPFDLLDQDGKRFTHEDLRGNYSLLYFGFTHCPDICPDELEKLATAIDDVGWSLLGQYSSFATQLCSLRRCTLGNRGQPLRSAVVTSFCVHAAEKQTGYKVLPVFITVDPERDSVPKVKAYVKQFHPRLIGLTGPQDKVGLSYPWIGPC